MANSLHWVCTGMGALTEAWCIGVPMAPVLRTRAGKVVPLKHRGLACEGAGSANAEGLGLGRREVTACVLDRSVDTLILCNAAVGGTVVEVEAVRV